MSEIDKPCLNIDIRNDAAKDITTHIKLSKCKLPAKLTTEILQYCPNNIFVLLWTSFQQN